MKRYIIETTETWTSEYHVEAESEAAAINKATSGILDPVKSFYNETNRDRDSMYVVEMKEDA